MFLTPTSPAFGLEAKNISTPAMMPPKPATIDLLAIVSISLAVTIDVTCFIKQK
jgi:hypothetical protein